MDNFERELILRTQRLRGSYRGGDSTLRNRTPQNEEMIEVVMSSVIVKKKRREARWKFKPRVKNYSTVSREFNVQFPTPRTRNHFSKLEPMNTTLEFE